MKKSYVIRALVALWLAWMFATVGPALFGDVLVLTAPLTCPGGHINVQTDVYHPRPGETDTTETSICTLAGGQTMEVPTLLSLAVLLGLALLPSLGLAFLIPYKFVAFADEDGAAVEEMRRDNARAAALQSAASAGGSGPHQEAAGRLEELNVAYAKKLITREEFEAKRKEILNSI